MLYGYARSRRSDPDLIIQSEELRRANVDLVYFEVAAVKLDARPVLDKLLASLSPGDTLFVWRLDILANSVDELDQYTARLSDGNVRFVSLKENLDTSTNEGVCFVAGLRCLSQMLMNAKAEQSMLGLNSRPRGRSGGRPRKLSEEQVREALRLQREVNEAGDFPSRKEIAQKMGVSVRTIGRVAKGSYGKKKAQSATTSAR